MKNVASNTSTSISVSRFLLFLLPHWTTLCRIINACNFHTTYALLNQMKNQHNRSNKILQKLFKFSGSMNHLIVSEEKGPESGRSTWRYEHELEHLFLWQIESISRMRGWIVAVLDCSGRFWVKNLWKSNLFHNFLPSPKLVSLVWSSEKVSDLTADEISYFVLWNFFDKALFVCFGRLKVTWIHVWWFFAFYSPFSSGDEFHETSSHRPSTQKADARSEHDFNESAQAAPHSRSFNYFLIDTNIFLSVALFVLRD